MKKQLNSLIFLLAIAASSMLASCGGGDKKEVDKTGPEYTSAYICPMHCEGSGSAEAGTCPVCGMDYKENKKAAKSEDGDDHGHDHEGEEGHGHEHADEGANDSTAEAEEHIDDHGHEHMH